METGHLIDNKGNELLRITPRMQFVLSVGINVLMDTIISMASGKGLSERCIKSLTLFRTLMTSQDAANDLLAFLETLSSLSTITDLRNEAMGLCTCDNCRKERSNEG